MVDQATEPCLQRLHVCFYGGNNNYDIKIITFLPNADINLVKILDRNKP